ncbi:MAG: PIG-L family deacetylase [Candidatus Levybacteria bacterium]|nr:PIG-L family deacetylase [Candidatus Levybacteria bacterium]
MKKKKSFVCIFAHPDDEAFGPGGTIAKLTKEFDVYILCATRGQKGQNSSRSSETLSKIRSNELKLSAKILGVKKVFFLGFRDGTLSNNLYHKIADRIEVYLEKLRPEAIMTFTQNGVSGHIDHITVSMVTMYIFQKLHFIKEVWHHTGKDYIAEQMKNYFIYFPKGYSRSEVDKVVDISDVWEIKVQAMYQHASQMHDVERILSLHKGHPKEDYFLISKK